MKSALVVMTNAVAGKDGEFNDWYDKVHILEMLKVPAFAAAQRFTAVPWMGGDLPRNTGWTAGCPWPISESCGRATV